MSVVAMQESTAADDVRFNFLITALEQATLNEGQMVYGFTFEGSWKIDVGLRYMSKRMDIDPQNFGDLVKPEVAQNEMDAAKSKKVVNGDPKIEILIDRDYMPRPGGCGLPLKGIMKEADKAESPVCVKVGLICGDEHRSRCKSVKTKDIIEEVEIHQAISNRRDDDNRDDDYRDDDYRDDFHLLGRSTIVRFFRKCEVQGNLMLVMKWFNGLTLKDWVQGKSYNNLTPGKRLEKIRQIAYKATAGLSYLHNRIGFFHGDISPRNIMWNPENGRLKLIDYGFAVEHQDRSICKNRGMTMFFASKEVLDKKITGTCDVWSLGACIFFLMTKRKPWYFLQIPDCLGKEAARGIIRQAMDRSCGCSLDACNKMPLMCEIGQIGWMCPNVEFILNKMLAVNHTDRESSDTLHDMWRDVKVDPDGRQRGTVDGYNMPDLTDLIPASESMGG